MRLQTLSGFEWRFHVLLLSIGMLFSFPTATNHQLYCQVQRNITGASPVCLKKNGEVVRGQDGVV